MTREEKLAYSKGYWAGSQNQYPKSKPPLPDDDVIAQLIGALQELSNAVDGFLAQAGEDDELESTLGIPLDTAFNALDAYRGWIKDKALPDHKQ